LLIISLLVFSVWLFENNEHPAGLAACFGIALPSLYLLFLVTRAKTKANYSRLSSIAKVVMAAGLFLLLLIWIF